MVGFSCYAFEGIGVVMPIMSACDCPEKFDSILLQAMVTLTVVYCFFGDVCYLILGSDLDTTFITQELDQGSTIVLVLQVIYVINLLCSYAITIFPTNNIIEDYTLRFLSKKKDSRSKLIKELFQNCSRMMVCLAAAYCSIAIGKKLDKCLSVLGALLCAPLAILFPALLHLKSLAKTN
jgi:solute carrier family 36 (proton-coupled amino acid transporter)